MTSEIVVLDDKVLHLGLKKGELAENIFLVGDPARAIRVAKRFDEIETEVRNREYVTITGRYHGMPISVIGTGIGVDNVEIALVEAYATHAFDFGTGEVLPNKAPLKLIRIGTSAGIQDNVEPGVLAISNYALGLDNAGLFYDHPAADEVVDHIEAEALAIIATATQSGSRFQDKIIPYASKATPEVAAALVRHAEQLGIEFVVGITSSTPGFYGPSSRYIEGLANSIPSIKTELATLQVQEHKVVNMEMESSLMFHLAGHLGYQVGTICPVISKPRASTAIPDYSESVESAISVALGAMCQLNGLSVSRG